MNTTALINWRAGARAQRDAANNSPAVSRVKHLAFLGYVVIVHGLAIIGGCCLLALFAKSCGVV